MDSEYDVDDVEGEIVRTGRDVVDNFTEKFEDETAIAIYNNFVNGQHGHICDIVASDGSDRIRECLRELRGFVEKYPLVLHLLARRAYSARPPPYLLPIKNRACRCYRSLDTSNRIGLNGRFCFGVVEPKKKNE